MVGVITGDIINSRNAESPEQWLAKLKRALAKYGAEPAQWEIYRGDSFQLEVKDPSEALLAAIYIKSSMKTLKNTDARMAIGIGNKTYSASKISQSNGDAFIFSGEKFEKQKEEKQNLAIQTASKELNLELNLCLKLALIAMNNWSPGAAEFVQICIEKDNPSQKELSEILGISQSSVSERSSRAYYTEMLELNEFYKLKVKNLKDKSK